MIVGVPKEIKLQEHRIGLTPDSVKVLIDKNHEVLVEKNGGLEKFKYQLKRDHVFETDIYGGIMENECKNLLEKFFKQLNLVQCRCPFNFNRS